MDDDEKQPAVVVAPFRVMREGISDQCAKCGKSVEDGYIATVSQGEHAGKKFMICESCRLLVMSSNE